MTVTAYSWCFVLVLRLPWCLRGVLPVSGARRSTPQCGGHTPWKSHHCPSDPSPTRKKKPSSNPRNPGAACLPADPGAWAPPTVRAAKTLKKTKQARDLPRLIPPTARRIPVVGWPRGCGPTPLTGGSECSSSASPSAPLSQSISRARHGAGGTTVVIPPLRPVLPGPCQGPPHPHHPRPLPVGHPCQAGTRSDPTAS